MSSLITKEEEDDYCRRFRTAFAYYVHNVVLKGTLRFVNPSQQQIQPAMLALLFGGLHTKEMHAGPTSLRYVDEDVRCSIRIFVNFKLNVAGTTSAEAGIYLTWLLVRQIAKELNVEVYPHNIVHTNMQLTGYFPFEIDLVKLAKLIPTCQYDEMLISSLRVYPFRNVVNEEEVKANLESKIQCSIYPSGSIVVCGASDLGQVQAAISLLLRRILQCAILPAGKRLGELFVHRQPAGWLHEPEQQQSPAVLPSPAAPLKPKNQKGSKYARRKSRPF